MGYTHIQVIDVTCKTPHFEPSPAASQGSQSSSGGSVVGTPSSSQSVYVTSAESSPSPAPQGPVVRSAGAGARADIKRHSSGGSRKSRKRTTPTRRKITRKLKKRVFKKKPTRRRR